MHRTDIDNPFRTIEVQGVIIEALIQLLRDKGVITQEELDSALAIQITGMPNGSQIQTDDHETD